MTLDFKPEEKDFFKAIGITVEDEEAFKLFKRMYYLELQDKFESKKAEGKLNAFQLKKYALSLSSHSQKLQTGLEWFKDHKRKDQMIILLLGEIFFAMAMSEKTQKQLNKINHKPEGKTIN